MTRWKTLVVDELTFQSSTAEVFGGGDCITGPDTLIAALAAGKKGAKFIAKYLEEGESQPENEEWMEKTISDLGVFDPKEKMPFPGLSKRPKLVAMDPEERITNFEEVESGITGPEALKEAARCLRCYRIGLAAV